MIIIFRHIEALFIRHASFFLLGFFSACYFVSMIIARKTLTPDDLYFWNAFVTLVAISFTFCFLGTEQLFLRFSEVDQIGCVTINRSTLWLMVATLSVFSGVLIIIAESYFFDLDDLVIYLILTASVGLFVFVYNFLRVQKSFFKSQLAANGWKLTILIGLILTPFGNLPLSIKFSLGGAVVVAILLFLQRSNLIIVNANPMHENWKSLFLGFFLSLFVLMLLNNADRLVITRYGSETLFSEYVYLVTLLLLPFSLLSNYFGFKEIAYLKVRYKRQNLLRKSLMVGLFGGGLSIPWFGFIYKLQDILEVAVHLKYVLPCFVIIVCRCIYSLLSALIGLKAKSTHIHMANILTFSVILVGVVAVINSGVNILNILFVSSFFWSVRLSIFWYLAIQIDEYSE